MIDWLSSWVNELMSNPSWSRWETPVCRTQHTAETWERLLHAADQMVHADGHAFTRSNTHTLQEQRETQACINYSPLCNRPVATVWRTARNRGKGTDALLIMTNMVLCSEWNASIQLTAHWSSIYYTAYYLKNI